MVDIPIDIHTNTFKKQSIPKVADDNAQYDGGEMSQLCAELPASFHVIAMDILEDAKKR